MGIRVDLSDYAEDQDKKTEIQMKEKQNQQGDTSSSSEVPPQPTPQQPPEENAPPQSSENKEEVSKSIEDNVEIVPSEAMEVDETVVTSLSNTGITDAVIISSTVTIPTSSEITVVTSVSSCENVIYSRSTVGQESTPPCSSALVTEDPGVLLSSPTSAPSTPDVFNSCTPLSSIPISGNN